MEDKPVSVPVSHRWEKRSPRLIRDGSEMGTMTRGFANGSAPRRECQTRSRGTRAPAPCAPPVQCVPRARDTETTTNPDDVLIQKVLLK